MQARNFLCCLLLLLGAVQLIEARGGGGRIGGGRGIFSGWFKSSKPSSSSSASSSSSMSSPSTSNGGVKWNRPSYSSSIGRPYSGYRSMSYPSYNSDYNSGYNNGYNTGSSYQSLDNDEYAGLSTGLQTSRYINDLMQLLRMRLPNEDPETVTEETFTINPSDILEVERSMNISAWFNLIKPITDKIFGRMGARLANMRQSTATTTATSTSQAEMTVASQEVDEQGNVASVTDENVRSTTPSPFVGMPRTTLPWPRIICNLMIKNYSKIRAKTIQNPNHNCFPVTDSTQAISRESLKEAGSAGDDIGYMTPSVTEIETLQLQSAVATDLKPVLKTMQQKEPRKIFNVPDEMF